MSRRIFATAKPSAIGGRVLPMSAVDAEINRRWAPLAKARLYAERQEGRNR